MKTYSVPLVLVLLSGLGLCRAASAADVSPTPQITDIALQNDGVLLGKVINREGNSQANLPVTLRFQDKELVTTRTNQDGYFAIKGVRGGVHQLVTTDGHGIYRLWAPGTAPPYAEKGAVLTTGQEIIRGQAPESNGRVKAFFTNPLVIAGIVATAVAVPIALSQHHSTSP